ncbi:MAG: DUF2726 domain-containing protein [Planctomycetota bacterium]|uniref:DUF2726 domain-containing protein n=1 Tax=uncultured Gimesia sp. TaxID=1678688 RepID=UPI0026315B48|nr:DUF2726 domain-containing protein [uncultured Gimesia sp.]
MPKTDNDQPQGCLTKILTLVGLNWLIKPKEKKTLPYRLKDNFLSPAEASFYGVLKKAVGEELLICLKVNLGDLFFVSNSIEKQAFRNKINRKHVDFLLCDPTLIKPLLGVELDDSSHSRKDRQERDQFVDSVFAAAGLPLLHVPAARGYRVPEIAELIHQHLKKANVQPAEIIIQNDKPLCPKCDTPMVVRKSTKGMRKGQEFWGCNNYPQCRETIMR